MAMPCPSSACSGSHELCPPVMADMALSGGANVDEEKGGAEEVRASG